MSASAIEWSPPRTTGTAPASTASPHQCLERVERAQRVGGHDRRVAEVDDPKLREGVDTGLEVRPGGQLAARIALGPKRAPGRSETRSSIGAPITATSTPASSAALCVYGMPAKVSRPA